TDIWISMGQENETEQRLNLFQAYSVDIVAMDQASYNSIFLHFLPSYHECEVSSDVIYGSQLRVFVLSENGRYTQSALVEWLLYASGLAEIPEELVLPHAEASRSKVH